MYLIEKGRISLQTRLSLEHIIESDTNGFVMEPLLYLIVLAMAQIPRSDIPDMPDRIIAATALALQLPLITRDHKIVTSFINTVW